jgi:hypothetical protein
MKKALCLVSMLAIVASASAYIEIFTTLNDGYMGAPGLYDTSERNFNLDWTDTVPSDSGAAPYPVLPGATEDLMVWGRFVQEPVGVRIFGLHIGSNVTGGMDVAQSAIYRHQKGTAWDRWDNDAPILMHPGIEGVGVAAAVVADGIQYVDVNNPDLIADSNGDGTLDTFLIGAIQADATNGAVGDELYIGLGTLGVIMYDETGNNSLFPDVYVQGNLAQTGGAPPTSPVFGLAAVVIPEPAGLLLLGLAGLVLRRR